MKHKHMATGGILFFIAAALLLLNASGCLAGGAQDAVAAQNPNLEMSPFKGPSTAPVVITVFSDFQ